MRYAASCLLLAALAAPSFAEDKTRTYEVEVVKNLA
jgi:hypothetical protein